MFLEPKELPFSQWWDNNTLHLSLGTLDTQSQNRESIMCRIIQKHYLSSFSSSVVHILFSAFLQGRVMRTRTLCALSGGWQNQKSSPGLTNCMVQTLSVICCLSQNLVELQGPCRAYLAHQPCRQEASNLCKVTSCSLLVDTSE